MIAVVSPYMKDISPAETVAKKKKTGNTSEANVGVAGLRNARRTIMHRLSNFSSETFENLCIWGFCFCFNSWKRFFA